ncbi:hypothetical protein TNCV_1601231 [Trichonephila clavipes]|nr:hypothetical protein TNCV_1601231 [Trichonephila clavipes]
MDLAPRQRSNAHCALCKTVISEQTLYCARESTVLTKSRNISLISVFKREEYIDENTLSVCRRLEGKNGRLTENGDI